MYNLKLDIYFDLTIKQRRKLNLIISHTMLEYIDMRDFLKITKKQDLIQKLIELKRSTIRSVA